MSTPPLLCSFGLGRGIYCAEPDGTEHEHVPQTSKTWAQPVPHLRASFEGRLVCTCGDFNCASLDQYR